MGDEGALAILDALEKNSSLTKCAPSRARAHTHTHTQTNKQTMPLIPLPSRPALCLGVACLGPLSGSSRRATVPYRVGFLPLCCPLFGSSLRSTVPCPCAEVYPRSCNIVPFFPPFFLPPFLHLSASLALPSSIVCYPSKLLACFSPSHLSPA